MTARSLAIDIGGTFTDVAVERDDGTLDTFKVSTDAMNPISAVALALHSIGPGSADAGLVLHATTVATNALLERKLQPTVLLATRGHRDVLEFRRSKRAKLYSIGWDPPPPIVPRDLVYEVDERMGPRGEVWHELTEAELGRIGEWVLGVGPAAVAISLLHSYANPMHEQMIRDHLSALAPGLHVAVSSELAPERGEYERTSTTVVHAALMPVMSEYIGQLESMSVSHGEGRLLVMQSSGGLATAQQIASAPGHAVESGPAAGALFAGVVAREAGIDRAIAFDVGGTTAKACLLEHGVPAETAELRVGGEMHSGDGFADSGGYLIRSRSIDLVEVGAGGGSLCRVDVHGVLHVGPDSAGADPGPAAYGRGNEVPTVTDANLVLGFLDDRTASSVTLDRAKARMAIEKHIAEPLGLTTDDAAWLVFRVANSNMLRALEAVSSERGRDPATYSLLAFGGGGPTHAAAIAAELGMHEVLIPPAPETFSAVGLRTCSIRRDLHQPFEHALDALVAEDANAAYLDLERRLSDVLLADGVSPTSIEWLADVRFSGQATTLTVRVPAISASFADELAATFLDAYRTEYGHADVAAPIECQMLRVRAEAAISTTARPRPKLAAPEPIEPEVCFGPKHGRLRARRIGRSSLEVGTSIAGPVLIQDAQATVVVPPGDTASIDSAGNVRIAVGSARRLDSADGRDRSALQLFRNNLGVALDRMALTIARTAYSPLIADAHDFSVAIADREGRLVTQGLGALIHLGSVPAALEALRTTPLWPLSRGDIALVNDPYQGGTHLPDCIVLMPVCVQGELVAHVAAIADMSDIGGASAAGSWATGATELMQEGLVIPPVKLVQAGELNTSVLDLIARNVRMPKEVVGDLHGLVSAVTTGARRVEHLVGDFGLGETLALMDDLLAYGAERGEAEIRALGDASATFTDYLDDDGASDEPIAITANVRVEDGRVVVDFAGTVGQRLAGINATMSSTRSMVHYCVRTMLSEDFPDNAGFHDLIEIRAEPGTVVNARGDAPVANRGFTSFRVVDVLFGALAEMYPGRVWAAYDGGVGPVVFSGRRDDGTPFMMVEVFYGSTGARPWADGLVGVAPPIGNARNSSVEVQEARHPIKVVSFGFAPGTGGSGRFRGGDGMRRAWEVLCDEAQVLIRTERQRFGPWGLDGGEAGAVAVTTLVDVAGDARSVPGKRTITMRRGEVLIYQGAGCGGFGDPRLRAREAIERDVREGRVVVVE